MLPTDESEVEQVVVKSVKSRPLGVDLSLLLEAGFRRSFQLAGRCKRCRALRARRCPGWTSSRALRQAALAIPTLYTPTAERGSHSEQPERSRQKLGGILEEAAEEAEEAAERVDAAGAAPGGASRPRRGQVNEGGAPGGASALAATSCRSLTQGQ